MTEKVNRHNAEFCCSFNSIPHKNNLKTELVFLAGKMTSIHGIQSNFFVVKIDCFHTNSEHLIGCVQSVCLSKSFHITAV